MSIYPKLAPMDNSRQDLRDATKALKMLCACKN